MGAGIVVRGVLAALVIVGLGAAAEGQERALGDPIPGAMIKVGRKPPGGGTIVAEGTTDAQGQVRFAELPAGQYFVRVALAGKSWEIAADGAEQPMLLEGVAAAGSAVAGTRAAKPPVQDPKKFSRGVGDSTMTVEYGGDWIRVSLARGGGATAPGFAAAATKPVQPGGRPYVPAQDQDFSGVIVGNRLDKEVGLSREELITILQPLATEGFILTESKFVDNGDEIFLASYYVNEKTKETEGIGVRVEKAGEKLVISRAATVVKCSISDNGYCKCEIPFCWCPADPGVDSPGRKCGKLVVEKRQVSDFFNGLNSVR